MATVAALLNHTAANRELPMANRVSPMAASSSSGNDTTTSDSTSAGITANDFLTLLVTEMKNQDPTANTDPNEYINQLVNVNSLEQLININQTLTGAFGSSASSAYAQPALPATSDSTDSAARSASKTNGNSSSGPLPSTGSTTAKIPAPADPNPHSIPNNLVQGNLSVPAAAPMADRLSHALDEHLNMPFVK